MSLPYHYLLFVGPGRSGTTYLYRALRECYDVTFPESKEGYYYRNAERYTRMRWRIPATHVLGDGANGAYMDDQLAERVSALGARTLIVVTLRDHVDRARSMLKFDLSRGRSLWNEKGKLESCVLERRLTPLQLERIYSAKADVVVIDFDDILHQPEIVLNHLADLLEIPRCDQLPDIDKNQSEVARSVHIAGLATMTSNVLRAVGLRGLLQALKDNQSVHDLVFKTADGVEDNMSAEDREMLICENERCWELVAEHGREFLALKPS